MNLHAYNHLCQFKPRQKMLGRGTNSIAYDNGDGFVTLFTIDVLRLEFLVYSGIISEYKQLKSFKTKKGEFVLYSAIVPKMTPIDRTNPEIRKVVKLTNEIYQSVWVRGQIHRTLEEFWLKLYNITEQLPEFMQKIIDFSMDFGAFEISPDFWYTNFMQLGDKIVPYDCVIHANVLYNFVKSPN